MKNWKKATAAVAFVAAAAIVVGSTGALRHPAGRVSHFTANKHALAVANVREKLTDGGETLNGPAQERYENLAYPADNVAATQVQEVYQQYQSISKRPGGKKSNWQLVGPSTGSVPGEVTYTGRASTVSGRTTALVVAPGCHANDCKLFAGTAGGGVWEADNALSQNPNWHQSNDRIPSTAIGSLTFDPNDAKGGTLYAGTGEPNGSSDSEAGVGLYKSTDFGKSWSLVPGSFAVAKDRSIASIAVDPTNANHLYIGTALARHGGSSVNGGRYTPPNAPALGLYESTDGGQTFSLAYSKPGDPVNPASPNGGDFFRGGVTNVQADAATGDVYFTISDYGLYRKSGTAVSEIYTSPAAGNPGFSIAGRNEFAFAPLADGKLRIYLGEAVDAGGSSLYRTDDARAAHPVWTRMHAADNYCGGQCSYDMPVGSPAGHPNEVWVGGQMQYSEIFTAHQPSNGRAVQRSTDGGATFTDMTNDTLSPPVGMHPDQHAIAFDPDNTGIAFLASDGGVVRTSGDFADASGDCASRGLTPEKLAFCQAALKSIPTRIYSLNDGLTTLQFQSVTANPQNPTGDVIGGTQDNGTWAIDGKGSGFESVGGDGGQSAIDYTNPSIRIHSYYAPQHDVNFRGNDSLGWDWISDPLLASGEAASFYTPLIADPAVSQTFYDGLQHVWRTTDSGGDRAYLDQHCNEFTGDFTVSCGDWQKLGGPTMTGSGYGPDKTGSYVVAIAKSGNALWTATRRGRVFVSTNANAADPATVTFNRIDTAAQPTRFVSGIAVDPANVNHAYITYSGYNAYALAAGTAPGHVFDVLYNPVTKTATWTLIDNGLGDLPITGDALDANTGDLYASFDWGVIVLKKGATTWQPAAGSLPPVAVYGLTIDSKARVLYAATHGRSVWKLDLSK